MNIKNRLVSTFIVPFVLVCAFQTSAKTLRVGMETTFAPFEFYNAKNELVGFDVDMVNRLCEIMEDHCDLQNLPFDGLIGALKMRKIDFAISGIDITPQREQQIDFSMPYYENSAQSFIVNQNSEDLPFSDLQHKKIGVQNGTTQQRYLNTESPNTSVVNYNQITAALMDLKHQRIDAFFIDASVAKEITQNDPELKVLSEQIVDADYFGKGLGIAVRQSNKTLLDAINKALITMKEDGSYQAIYDKWFD